MKRPIRKWILIVLASTFCGAALAQGEISKSQSELKSIQKEIDSLKKKIQSDEKTLKKERATLQDTEKEIAAINNKAAQTRAQIEQAREKQQTLKAEADQERARITKQLDQLGDIVFSQHAVGDRGYLKLLLSQQDPAQVERSLVYYKYLAQLTSDQVIDSRAQVQQLVALEAKHAEQQQVLNHLLDTQKSEQAKLKQISTKRKNAIASLDNQLTKSANRIGRLEEDERRLKSLVRGLQEAVRKRAEARARAAAKAAQQRAKAAEQTAAVSKQNKQTTTVIQPVIQRVSNDGLGRLKGRLKMPVKGRISAGYGTTKSGSGIKWNGIMLTVNEGEPVRSIHDGQIVYADWFKGFGQLVIVDHGKGYMSLYSHNSRIARSLGEQVNANEVIAYSGATGGLSQPGLYFEVRYNGEPRDPLLWVKR